MGANHIKEYFIFTKKERIGVITLLVFIGLVSLLPLVLKTGPQETETRRLAAFKTALEQIKEGGSETEAGIVASAEADSSTVVTPSVVLFQFDPNTLDEKGWLQLGVSTKVAGTIKNYRAKGGRFIKPEDLSKIYGLKKELYETLLPYIVIAEARSSASTTTAVMQIAKPESTNPKEVKKLDINQADTTALIRLPMIGSKLAARIVAFREKLGGFYNVEQIAQVYGISPEAYQTIKPYLLCATGAVSKININTADYEQLRSHPYIKGQLAGVLIQYRRQHGSFSEVKDVKNIHLVTDEIFDKLVPYLATED